MRYRLLMVLFLVTGCLLLVSTVPSGWTQPPWDKKGDKGKKKSVNIEEWAEAEFQKRDKNGDGFLDADEAPGKLRDDFARWDENRDSKIDFAEFKRHLQAHTQEKAQKAAQKLGMLLEGGEEFARWAQQEFQKRDGDGNGFLDVGEAPGKLRDDFERWDKNGDGKIDFPEFKVHLRDHNLEKMAKDAEKGKALQRENAPILRDVIDDVDDTRPIVYRAGNLPKELPAWFLALDNNRDGQVSLREWVLGSKAIPEFQALDRNDDGLITAEEMLRSLQSQAPAARVEGYVLMGAGEAAALVLADFSPKGKGKGKGGKGKDKKGKGG